MGVNAARMSACATACVALIITGCGSIGEPLYPALHIPAPVTDLMVVEQGSQLDFLFTIQNLTTEGLPIKEGGIGMVDLRVGPIPPTGWNVDQWASGATSVPVPTPEKAGPIQASIAVGKFAGSEVAVAVRVTNSNGKDAGWSAPKMVMVRTPLGDPANFRAVADPKGVALSWTKAGKAEFHIFRKTEQQARPVLLATTAEPNYVDISAEFGKTYQYSIQAERDGIESDMVGPVTITPVDIFPPAVPSGLMVSAGINTLELAWNRNTESDFKEYRVLRSVDGGPFAEVARGLETPVYSDRMVQSGKRYRYEVESVDQDGHVSAPSAPVEMTAP
jgi:hypothetical protein